MAIAALLVSLCSFLAAALAVWYSRRVARANEDVARIEHERQQDEQARRLSANLTMRAVDSASERGLNLLIKNTGQYAARSLTLASSAKHQFVALVDRQAHGREVELTPGAEILFMVSDASGERCAVPWLPIVVQWSDGTGTHSVEQHVPRDQFLPSEAPRSE